MQRKTIYITVVLFNFFLLSFSHAYAQSPIPASVYYKIKPHDTLTRQELLRSVIVDSTDILPSVTEAIFDTTVSLNDSISWVIINLKDSLKACFNYFMATININTQSRLFYKYLYASCDINITTDVFEVHSYEILSEAHIILTSMLKQRLIHRQNFDEKPGDALKSSSGKKTSLWIKPDGEIIKSRKAPK
ncbi:MAG: hypothetical protein ABI594_13730 [Ginsengibacter sp.]